MEVVLVRFTDTPEAICAQAMASCQSTKAAHEIFFQDHDIKRLLTLAIKSGHESVLEHATFTFSIKGISRACSHQLVRHRIASFSQQSQRHVNPTKISDWYVTPPSTQKEDGLWSSQLYAITMSNLAKLYSEMISKGIPEEDARFILPNACKTNITVTMNARELRHFFKLRLSKSAQWEIREMANAMLKLCKTVAPIIFGEFTYEQTK